ncbi:MAG: helix-turn-helix transcriptional regulator [Bdellovibrio sp.]|nr:helix-turn-helix transcriptional regulator [Bdellovibrio sp.]
MKKSINSSLKQLGLIIKKERKDRALTQTQLGEISGTSINFVSQIESGKTTAHIGKVFRILQVLGIELHYQRGPAGLILPEILNSNKPGNRKK